jgi:hypothetical protein
MMSSPWPDEPFDISLAGAEVSRVETQAGGALCLRLAVAPVRGKGRARWFLTGVELVFVQPTAVHVDADAWGAVAEATLSEAGQPMLSVPVPWHTANAVQLALRFAQGGELTLQAQGLHVQLSSDSRCVEHLSC